MKLRYNNQLSVKDGKIRRSSAVNIEHANEEQKNLIESVKPIMSKWLRSNILKQHSVGEFDIVIRVKYAETSKGLSIDFKVQSMNEATKQNTE